MGRNYPIALQFVQAGAQGVPRAAPTVKWPASVVRAGPIPRAASRPAILPHHLQAANVTLHLTTIAGGNALSPFRASNSSPPRSHSPRLRPLQRASCLVAPMTRLPAPDQHERLAAADLRRPVPGPAGWRCRSSSRRAGHRFALGLQGHRHRAQLRLALRRASAPPNTVSRWRPACWASPR